MGLLTLYSNESSMRMASTVFPMQTSVTAPMKPTAAVTKLILPRPRRPGGIRTKKWIVNTPPTFPKIGFLMLFPPPLSFFCFWNFLSRYASWVSFQEKRRNLFQNSLGLVHFFMWLGSMRMSDTTIQSTSGWEGALKILHGRQPNQSRSICIGVKVCRYAPPKWKNHATNDMNQSIKREISRPTRKKDGSRVRRRQTEKMQRTTSITASNENFSVILFMLSVRYTPYRSLFLLRHIVVNTSATTNHRNFFINNKRANRHRTNMPRRVLQWSILILQGDSHPIWANVTKGVRFVCPKTWFPWTKQYQCLHVCALEKEERRPLQHDQSIFYVRPAHQQVWCEPKRFLLIQGRRNAASFDANGHMLCNSISLFATVFCGMLTVPT